MRPYLLLVSASLLSILVAACSGDEDCDAAFGTPELLFEEPGFIPQSLSPTSDELEFFYVRLSYPPSGENDRQVVMRTRTSASEAFGDPVEVLELSGLCPAALSELSGVGDRLHLLLGELG